MTVFTGSGVTLGSSLQAGPGVIVGSSLKAEGDWRNRVDPQLVRAFVQAALRWSFISWIALTWKGTSRKFFVGDLWRKCVLGAAGAIAARGRRLEGALAGRPGGQEECPGGLEEVAGRFGSVKMRFYAGERRFQGGLARF